MGKKDIALLRYFEDEDRYADLINGYMFSGKQAVSGSDIREMNAAVTGVFHRLKEMFAFQKYRDTIRKIVLGVNFVVIGLEHQDLIYYVMPVRVLIEDAASYDGQMRRIQRKNRKIKRLESGEFIGHFTKEDRLHTVLTIVLYYGETPWDGPKDLASLIFGFISRSGDKKAEQEFTFQNKEAFEQLDEDAYDVISVLTGSKELEDVKEKYREKGGKINMCEAIRGMIEDGKLEGQMEGQLEKSQIIAQNMFLRGMTPEDTAAICEENIDLVKEWFKTWECLKS